MKRLLIGIAVVAVILLAVVAALVLRLDPEALGARLTDQINRQSGLRLEADGFSLHPLRGLELANARISGRLDAGEIQAEVTLLRMKHRILPLLRRELVIDEILLLEPVFEVVTRSAEEVRQQKARQREERGQGRGKGQRRQKSEESAIMVEESDQEEQLRLSIESMSIQDGSLSIRSRDRERASFIIEQLQLSLNGITFDPAAPSSTEAVTGVGRMSTGRIVHGDLEASEARGQIHISRGVADVTELNVHSAHADLMIKRMTVLLLQEPPVYTLGAAGGLDLNGILGFEQRDGFGRVAIELGAEGEGPELREMVGEGTLTLNAGSIPGIPSVVQIEELVGQSLLTGRKYERTEIDYRLVANKVVLEPFEIASDGSQIGGSGEIDLAGPLALEVFVRLPRRVLGAGDLTEEQLESLDDGEGMVTLPFQIGGTIDDPLVQLTWDGMKALASEAAKTWAERALDEAKKRAEEWLNSQADDQDDG